MLSIDVIEPDVFVFNSLTPEDIPLVVAFAYRVAGHVGQHVYIAVPGINGRKVGGPPREGPPKSAVVCLGREDAHRVRWFGEGYDIVLWRPRDEEWGSDLIGQHWKRQRLACWGVLVDGRDIDGVVGSLQATWPRRYRRGDYLGLLTSTVGPERKLAMLSYDGDFFSGKASADCWDFVFALLKEMAGDKLEIYEDDRADEK